jgi:hypothetical protein
MPLFDQKIWKSNFDVGNENLSFVAFCSTTFGGKEILM